MLCFEGLGHGHVPPRQLTKPCKLPKKTFFRFTTIEIASLPTQANGTFEMSFRLFYLRGRFHQKNTYIPEVSLRQWARVVFAFLAQYGQGFVWLFHSSILYAALFLDSVCHGPTHKMNEQ